MLESGIRQIVIKNRKIKTAIFNSYRFFQFDFDSYFNDIH